MKITNQKTEDPASRDARKDIMRDFDSNINDCIKKKYPMRIGGTNKCTRKRRKRITHSKLKSYIKIGYDLGRSTIRRESQRRQRETIYDDAEK